MGQRGGIMKKGPTFQVKICGLSDPLEAKACADLGADAVGLVFYPKSPRHVNARNAEAVRRALPETVQTIGVFVDEDEETIAGVASKAGLTGVQLHGKEPPELVKRLKARGLLVIKGLYLEGTPSVRSAADYEADAFLIECKRGVLPGGNALSWDWRAARGFSERHPLVLAGGLGPDTVARAISSARPDAVDVSSGVEAAAGQKDIRKVQAFIDAVRQCRGDHPRRRIF
jgi:phosphoribosylanthranilate isomerase